MPLFAKPLRGIGFAGLTFRNNTKIASGEFRVADEVLPNRCFMQALFPRSGSTNFRRTPVFLI